MRISNKENLFIIEENVLSALFIILEEITEKIFLSTE